MKRVNLIGILAGATLFALPLAAMASVNVQNLTLDGLANTTVDVGDTVGAQVTYQTTAGDDVESLSWDLQGSGLPQTCVDIPDQINAGIWHPQFDINTNGATAGSWDVNIKLYGVNGSGTDQQCGTTAKDTMNFSNRIAITEQTVNNTGVGAGTGSHSGNGSSSAPAWLAAFQAQLAALIAALHPTTPVPTVSPACAAYAQATVGTQMNVYNSANIALQGFLLSQHMSIPALAAGASFGYWGNQTEAARVMFVSANHCN